MPFDLLWQNFLVAFLAYFAAIGPIDVAAIFASITAGAPPRARRAMALKGVGIAAAILGAFLLFGPALLKHLGISLAALRTAGGVLLFLIALDMVFARHSGGSSASDEERVEAVGKEDVSVFPLATPLIAGPGAIGLTVLLIAEREGAPARIAAVVTALCCILLLTYVLLLGATRIQKLLGVTGLNVVTRVVGVLLAALAVQFVFDGLADSGLFTASDPGGHGGPL
nr:MarC family protein [Marivibrio halodurans]